MNDRYDLRTSDSQPSWHHTLGRVRCYLALLICGTARQDQESPA
ncbi:hypothetical protein [Nocardioides faecalis]|nr:hypothetical protein [Nocardioides faecalis]